MALQQELCVLLVTVLVHAATRVARLLVTIVKVVVLVNVDQRQFTGTQIGVAFPGPALAAVGLKIGDPQANRDAGLAMVAIWSVGKDAAAPEAGAHELAIDHAVDQMGRRGNLRASFAVGQVAARVGRGRIVEQQRVGQVRIVRLGHGYLMGSRGSADQTERGVPLAVSVPRRSRKAVRGISRPPSEARCSVYIWQSIIPNWLATR